MADAFSLDDALGQTNASGQQNQNQSQGQNWNNPWGGPGQPYPGGAPVPGQQYPGAPQGGQQYPGAPQGGQQYPGFPSGGQQYPGAPPGGQQYPGGFPPAGQQYPGGYPGYPGFPAPGQQYPGQPTDPKSAGQFGPTAPAVPGPTGPLKVPYTLPLPGGIMPGMVLTIQGVVSPSAKRWTVDFKNNDNIVFHFNPRYDENPNVMVRNSMLGGKWGSEERAAQKFPFLKGQSFMIQIFIEPDQFRVGCNNETLLHYKHRNREFAQIKSVQIGGDITLNGATVSMM